MYIVLCDVSVQPPWPTGDRLTKHSGFALHHTCYQFVVLLSQVLATMLDLLYGWKETGQMQRHISVCAKV